mmetsp:Transcript_9045/g.37002  ORF Transcript_9045/g.37002 Transcript_9045/m.37002 type:complete len:155 (-) Transcript_9045:1323-1787(-)
MRGRQALWPDYATTRPQGGRKRGYIAHSVKGLQNLWVAPAEVRARVLVARACACACTSTGEGVHAARCTQGAAEFEHKVACADNSLRSFLPVRSHEVADGDSEFAFLPFEKSGNDDLPSPYGASRHPATHALPETYAESGARRQSWLPARRNSI